MHFPNVLDDFAFTLNLPMIHYLEDWIAYCSNRANLLGEIVKRISGQTLQVFADENSFNIIIIAKNQWYVLPNQSHYEFSGTGNSIKPRDMARLYLLYLNIGKYDEYQVVFGDWINMNTTRKIKTQRCLWLILVDQRI